MSEQDNDKPGLGSKFSRRPALDTSGLKRAQRPVQPAAPEPSPAPVVAPAAPAPPVSKPGAALSLVPTRGDVEPAPPPAAPAPAAPDPAKGRVDPNTAVVYIDKPVHTRLKRWKLRHEGLSFNDAVLEATDAAMPVLAALFPTQTPRGGGSVFPARRQRQRRVLSVPQVQVTLRPGRDAVAILDRLAEEVGVNRSEFVNRVLHEWLPGKPRGSRA